MNSAKVLNEILDTLYLEHCEGLAKSDETLVKGAFHDLSLRGYYFDRKEVYSQAMQLKWSDGVAREVAIIASNYGNNGEIDENTKSMVDGALARCRL